MQLNDIEEHLEHEAFHTKKYLFLYKFQMVKHIVFFKLPKSLTQEKKQLELKRMEEIFAPLGGVLPYIIEYRTGTNFNDAPHAWDFVIDSVFRSKEDLQKYQNSEEHKAAIRRGSEIEKTKAVIDYEF